MEICPVCLQETEPIYVHGHYQCSVCGTNIVPCCNGETENEYEPRNKLFLLLAEQPFRNILSEQDC